jgi:TPP-dependent pyruvate/acetoin dehydrogenase alpha subunit
MAQLTKTDLIAFEDEIAVLYCDGKIRAPIHLSDGNEDQLIEIFRNISRDDWVFSAWRSHYHALLHGIGKEWLKAEIMAGNSITINNPERHFFSSALVGGICPIAVGVAMGLKMNGSKSKVWVFVGDMTAETGTFHECVKYSQNHDLPINFVIEDNGQSVGTPTRTVWGEKELELSNSHVEQVAPKLYKYAYVKNKYPHVGAGKWVKF